MKNDILKNLKTLFNLEGGGSLEALETDVSAEFDGLLDDEAVIDSLLSTSYTGDCNGTQNQCKAQW